MKIKVDSLLDDNVIENEVEIIIKSPKISREVKELIDYIKQFPIKSHKKIIVKCDGFVREIKLDEIICFYSDKKHNYCRTNEKVYKIKSKLYEIEKLDSNFIRISKACIVNSNQIKLFDLNESGRIVVILNDGSKEVVSRRKIRSIMEFLEERSI